MGNGVPVSLLMNDQGASHVGVYEVLEVCF